MLRSASLPDPDTQTDADVVIYDGDCVFCKSQIRSLRRLDWGGRRLAFISLHDPRVTQRYPDLTHEAMMKQMYVVDTRGRRHGGSEAVKYLSRRLPMLWPAMPILHIPGTAGLWRWMYGQVAKRRYKIAGKMSGCDDDACSVHFDK
ncbi:hypothetical protein Poly51_43150 [Rubripirellula tenax]|uniref:Thiol-disulfide oxidoreductase n=1 Tax=Rubripirellula tenax TaxID=2528015 RepID=A0A5C6EUQ1_9BACT|nr:DUF393 domain-containing protein [Rubripirellula tenax]TWU51021.1 hypothetical protein Poly51_43150 [Rubripirellula tenax]